MAQEVGRSRLTRFCPALFAAGLLAFVVAATRFAIAQNLWIDETTQLSGITLPPLELLRWLAGEASSRFGVPGDRMPPLGYLFDWVSWRILGGSELGLRLVHLALVAGAIAVTAAAARRHLGATAGLGTLAVLVLSARLVMLAPELRAYPLFLLFSAGAIAVALPMFKRESAAGARARPGELLRLGLLCLLTTYVHFFGVVLSATLWGALVLSRIGRWPEMARFAAAGIVVALLSAGIAPFVLGAVQNSPDAAAVASPDLRRLATFAGQLLLVPPNLMLPAAAAVMAAGWAGLLAFAAAGTIDRIHRRAPIAADWLWVVLAIGIGVTIAASVAVRSFDALKPPYSLWTVPAFALLAGNGLCWALGRGEVALRRAGWAVLLLYAGGAAVGLSMLLVAPTLFVHGPERALLAAWERAGRPPIVYAEGAAWGWGYFPIHYRTAGAAAQFQEVQGGLQRLTMAIDRPVRPGAQVLAGTRRVMVVDLALRDHAALRRCYWVALCERFGQGALTTLPSGANWREVVSERRFGNWDTRIRIYER